MPVRYTVPCSSVYLSESFIRLIAPVWFPIHASTGFGKIESVKMAFTFSNRVRFADTDGSTRIHYSAMLRYFDAAEHEFLRSIGLKYQDLQAAGVALPRVHVEGTYTGAVYFDDLVAVQVRVEKVGTSSFSLAFSASIGERPVANGRITIVALDLATQKARPLPVDWVSKLRGHTS